MSGASDKAPLVAIVTPVYNGEAFLAETMDAVQAQTYPNVVHVVHDNASTDATPRILVRYRDARIPVVVTRNAHTLPIAQNWNAAVTRVPAEAAYFRVLCADDLIEPDFVTLTVSLAERHPSIAVVGCGLKHRANKAEEMRWDPDRELFPGQEAVRRYFLGTGSIIAHQTLLRRSALERQAPFFDEDIVNYDTDACLRLLHNGDWGFVHSVLAETREHPGTYSHAITDMKFHQFDHLALLERHAEFAFGTAEGRDFTRKYRRYYLRQLLRWRASDRRELYDWHKKAIKRFSRQPLAWQFLDAIADWPLARLGLRPVWTGYPF